VSGQISNVTFVGDYVMITVNTGLPDNCLGTAWGWMRVPPENKAIIALVTGLWLRGDAATTTVTVYTNPIDSSGYCTVNQIHPTP
jgi:hypothetical protein